MSPPGSWIPAVEDRYEQTGRITPEKVHLFNGAGITFHRMKDLASRLDDELRPAAKTAERQAGRPA
ncbi:MAG: hypothetical protein JWO56_729 [Acidobacteria bacterium]|nr:hypothetical protein [Acidobacteriota bacterium]